LFLFLVGCGQPIGVTKVSPEESYRIATSNPLAGEGLSNDAKAVLQRSNLYDEYQENPASAIKSLHDLALKGERRDILFALAEISYSYASILSPKSSKGQWITRENAYLSSAIYAYLYLLNEDSQEPPPSPYDHRFREACELYNRSLALAFANGKDDGLQFETSRHHLVRADLPLAVDRSQILNGGVQFQGFYPSDAYDVYGFSVRNRSPGLGLPIIGVAKARSGAPNGGAIPLTAFLRLEGGLGDIDAGKARATLELYSAYSENKVVVHGQTIPLQSDTTAPLAYRLNDPDLWSMGLKRFISGEQVKDHILMMQPFEKGRIPVVLVHGTGSSPVWWAEMVNTLRNDPVVRNHYQFWFYEYTSNMPIMGSASDLRDVLTATVHELDPKGEDPALRNMIVIGHSQGGLLTHMTAVDAGDKLWKAISDKPFDQLDVDDMMRGQIKKALFFEHLPFVKRVVFISTPHRGSFLTKEWVRSLASKLLSLPKELIMRGSERFQKLFSQLKLPAGAMGDALPTSIDGMSPSNPILHALAELPFAAGIKANSIIAVLPDERDVKGGNDGVVEYSSAHLDGVESELVVRTGHSAQGHPLTIEEVRRILHLHLEE
jgi:pimeloyl-ACP methyl ester carboxylesterase